MNKRVRIGREKNHRLKQQKLKAYKSKEDRPKEQKSKVKLQGYEMSMMQKVYAILLGGILILMIALLFYATLWMVIPLSPLMILVYRLQKRGAMEKEKQKLNLQFKDALVGMTSAMSAGYSVENSITEALKDLRCIYKEEERIIREFLRMEQKLHMNATIEDVFFEFGARSGVEDIRNFAWILYTAKRTGGDLIKITKNTSNRINERVEVMQEIQTVITAKRLEANIMNVVPLAILFYLRIGCPGFLDPLYGNLLGMVVMTGVLVGYIVAYLISQKIIHIMI